MASPHFVAMLLLALGAADLVLLNLWLVPAAWSPPPSRAQPPVARSAVALPTPNREPTAAPRADGPASTGPDTRDQPSPPSDADGAPPVARPAPDSHAAEPAAREVFRDVLLFHFDSAVLDEAARAAVVQAAQAYRQQRNAEVRIDGHADASGDEAYNLRLSERRARAVADALERKGIPAARMTVKGYGPVLPPPAAPGPAAPAQQRRVEIVVRSSAS